MELLKRNVLFFAILKKHFENENRSKTRKMKKKLKLNSKLRGKNNTKMK